MLSPTIVTAWSTDTYVCDIVETSRGYLVRLIGHGGFTALEQPFESLPGAFKAARQWHQQTDAESARGPQAA